MNLAVQIGLECLFGRASDFYTNVYESGLIDESYAYDFSLEQGFGFALIGTDTQDPDKFAELVLEQINKVENEDVFKWMQLSVLNVKKSASSYEH